VKFFMEAWAGFRPYLLKLTVDFLVAGSIWLFLFLFTLLTKLLPISGWAARFLVFIDSLGAVAAMVMLVWFAVNDTIQLHRGGMVCFA
jgi:hypothetical protein